MSNAGFENHDLDNIPGATGFAFPSTAARPTSRLGRIDPAAIARAEAALKGLASQFGQWLRAEVEKLQAALDDVRNHGLNSETADRLYACAHDLKGLGTTYEFPIITRISGMLCKVLGDTVRQLDASIGLLDAHVDAIVACVRDDIRDPATPAGRAWVERLERDVGSQAL